MVLVVDFKDHKFTHIHPYNLKNCKFREKLIPCELYNDGVLPGMTKDGVQQMTTVRLFRNFIEFSKVTEDEIGRKNNKNYLLSKFFDRRSVAISSKNYMKKEGDAIAYYLTGRVYSKDMFSSNVFPALVNGVYDALFKVDPILFRLRKSFKDGEVIEIKVDSLPEELQQLKFHELFLEILKDG